MTGTQEGVALAIVILSGVAGVVIFLCRLIHRAALAMAKRAKSSKRDHLAHTIGEHLRDGKTPPAFALYLRPFRSTGYQYFYGTSTALVGASFTQDVINTLVSERPELSFAHEGHASSKNATFGFLALVMIIAFSTDWVLWRGYLALRRWRLIAQARKLESNPLAEHGDVVADFEDFLEDGISKSHRLNLVALGNPGEVIGGAGRLRVKDEEWQHYIGLLIERAALNVLVLSPRPGTLWEIEQVLKSEHWKKTLFIQPPLGGVARNAYAPDAEYQVVSDVFARYGFEMPPRDERGVAFALYGPGKPPLSRIDIRSMRSLVSSYKMVDGIRGPLAELFVTAPPPTKNKPGPWDPEYKSRSAS